MTRVSRRCRGIALALAIAVALAAGCAPKVVPAAPPTTPRYPEFPFPDIPASLASPVSAELHQQAWWSLQSGDLRGAERGFSAALDRESGFYPSAAGLGYVALAERNFKSAVKGIAGRLVGALLPMNVLYGI